MGCWSGPDPPFNTGTQQKRQRVRTTVDPDGDRRGFKGQRFRSEAVESAGYDDRHDDYRSFIRPRIEVAHRRRRLVAAGDAEQSDQQRDEQGALTSLVWNFQEAALSGIDRTTHYLELAGGHPAAAQVFAEADFSVMHTYPIYANFGVGALDPDTVPFATALTAALSGRPAMMEEFGACTAPPGSPTTIPREAALSPSCCRPTRTSSKSSSACSSRASC